MITDGILTKDLYMTINLQPFDNQMLTVKVKKSDGTWAKLIGELEVVVFGNTQVVNEKEILKNGNNNLVAVLRLKNLKREIHTKKKQWG